MGNQIGHSLGSNSLISKIRNQGILFLTSDRSQCSFIINKESPDFPYSNLARAQRGGKGRSWSFKNHQQKLLWRVIQINPLWLWGHRWTSHVQWDSHGAGGRLELFPQEEVGERCSWSSLELTWGRLRIEYRRWAGGNNSLHISPLTSLLISTVDKGTRCTSEWWLSLDACICYHQVHHYGCWHK